VQPILMGQLRQSCGRNEAMGPGVVARIWATSTAMHIRSRFLQEVFM